MRKEVGKGRARRVGKRRCERCDRYEVLHSTHVAGAVPDWDDEAISQLAQHDLESQEDGGDDEERS